MFLKLFNKKTNKNSTDLSGDTRLVHGIDREMNYCPSCGEEFRSDIVSCTACEVQLVSGEEKIAEKLEAKKVLVDRSMEIGPDDNLIAIRKGAIKDIKNLQKLLAKERVPAVIAGDETGCGKSCCGPEMYLKIRQEDLGVATEVLAKDFVKTTALDLKDLIHAEAVFDHQAAENTCPACGCRFSPTVGACPDCGLCFE